MGAGAAQCAPDGPATQGDKKARAPSGTSPGAPLASGGRGMAERLSTPLPSANVNELSGNVTQNGEARASGGTSPDAPPTSS